MEKRYFAASNSSQGFMNYYKDVFITKKCKRLFVIKGGPGTGKSRFMRDISACAEKNGHQVKYYYCSSDPNSLDGITISDMGISFIDGTAPHVYEPTCVGAFEEIINLGGFWDGDILLNRASEIKALSLKKQEHFAHGYRYLKACGEIGEVQQEYVMPCVRLDKVERAVNRILRDIPGVVSSDVQGKEVALCESVGMLGEVRFDTYEGANEVIHIEDYMDVGHVFLRKVSDVAETRGIPVIISFDPVFPKRINAIEIPSCNVSIVLDKNVFENEEKTIKMQKYIDNNAISRDRKKVRLLLGLKKELIDAACREFGCASEYHFELEKIYSQAMNFSEKEKFTQDLCAKLFSE